MLSWKGVGKSALPFLELSCSFLAIGKDANDMIEKASIGPMVLVHEAIVASEVALTFT